MTESSSRLSCESGGPEITDRADRRWWSLKAYLDPAMEAPFLEVAIAGINDAGTSSVDCWFFVRYSDQAEHATGATLAAVQGTAAPGPHIRLRVRCAPATFAALRQRLAALRLGPDSVAPSIVETHYESEYQRYGGGHGLELVHDIFMFDSLATVELAGDVRRDQVVAAVSALDLLRHVGLTAEETIEVYSRRIARIARDLGMTESRLLDHADRNLPTFISGWPAASAAARGQTASTRHASGLANAGAQLREAAQHGRLSRDLTDILVDVQHMHLNRLDVPTGREASLVLLTGQAIRRGLLS